jgi:hypothetical protein
MALVDKTGAIADLLNHGAPDAHRVFFARPRKFGKSLTLSIAGEMLAAGALPPGVAPWPGYAPADARALFGGLQVHERLLRGDASLGSLLQRPHFVVKLGLGGTTSGSQPSTRRRSPARIIAWPMASVQAIMSVPKSNSCGSWAAAITRTPSWIPSLVGWLAGSVPNG